MSNAIVSRTISAVVDQRLSLGAGQAARLLEYLTTWTKVRLGIRFAFDAAATLTGTPQLVIGMSADTANAYADATTDHFFGLVSSNSTWTYAGSPAYMGTVGFTTRKRITTTNTDSGTFGSTYLTAAAATNRNALIIEITKGSPNFTIDLVSAGTTGAAQHDITDAEMISMMEASTMSGAAGMVTGYAAAGAVSVAIDEVTHGYLNAANIYWDRSGSPLEISDFRHRRVA